MLTGHLPFDGVPDVILKKQQSGDVPFIRTMRREVRRGCESVIRRALALQPDRRFAGVTEFADALQSNVQPVPWQPIATAALAVGVIAALALKGPDFIGGKTRRAERAVASAESAIAALDFRTAASRLRDAIALNPQHARAQFRLAQIQQWSGEPEWRWVGG